MHNLLFLLPALLTACDPDLKDTAMEEPGFLDLDVGDVGELAVDGDGVWAELSQPGSYILILASMAEDQGVTYGYGDSVAEGKQVDPPDTRPTPPEGQGPVPPPTAVGDTRTFNVYNGSINSNIEALAIEVTDGVVLWEDQTTPNESGDVEQDTIDEILTDMESIIVPREEVVFGDISDVDGDDRLAVLLSYTVNQYGSEAYVSWCDIGVTDGCFFVTNEGEVIYLSYPDTDSSRSSADGYEETIAHELAHLIYAYHKYVLNGSTSASENVYVTEGMSALAQDLTGYNNGNQYVWAAAIDMSDYYGSDDYSVQAISLNDILRQSSYYDEQRDGALRGGAYLMMRYLFEQAGGMQVESDGAYTDLGGIAWVQQWFNAPEEGVDALEITTGRDFEDVAMDFFTTLVVSGRGLNDDPSYNFQSRVEDPITGYEFGVDTYATIHGWLELTGPVVQALDEADGGLRAGGVEYLAVEAEAGELRLAVDAEAVPRARLFRIE